MATGGHRDSSEEDITSEEEDCTQYTVDEELFDDDTAKMLQQLELPTLDEQPGTSSKQQGKTIDTGTSQTAQHTAPPPLLQRTPKIESTPLSMEFVKKLLVRKHGVKEEEAQAAVQSQGCDIEMCLQWIERNRYNFTLLEEKSQEYKYSCGMISEPDMRKWAIEWLIERYAAVPEAAKAAVQSKGVQAFGDCKRCVFTATIAEEYLGTSSIDQKTSHKILKEEKDPSSTFTAVRRDVPVGALIQKDHMEWFGIKGELLKALLCVNVDVAGFATFFEWVLRNQHDERKLTAIEALHSGFVKETSNDHFGREFKAVQNGRYLASFILSDFMPEMVAMAAVQAGRPGHINLDECRKWAEENKDKEDHVQNISWSTELLQRFKKCYNLVDSLMNVPRWKRFDNDPRWKRVANDLRWGISDGHIDLACKIAEISMIATSSTDKSECLKWIEKSRRKASEERKIVILLISRMYNTLKPNFYGLGEFEDVVRHVTQMEDHQWLQDGSDDEVDTWRAKGGWRSLSDTCEMLSMAAIKATSSTDFDTCRTWITRNAANKEKVLRLYQQYKNSRVGLGRRDTLLEDGIFVWLRSDYHFISIVDPSKQSTAGKIQTRQEQDDQASSKTRTPVGDMKTLAATNTEKHEQETEAANLSCDSDGFLQISELKAEKVQKMGPVGGEIDLEECSLIFPEGAVKEEKKFNVTLIHNPKKFPSFSIPITPILGCRPSMEFDKPVTVKMRTCYSAIGNAEITASLYQREDEGAEWVEVQKVTLTSNNQVQFDVMHFSDDMVGVSDDAGSLGEYHLINNVYIEKDTGRIASMFFVDQGAHDLATEDMRKRGIVTMMMKSKKIIAKMGTEINVAMECTRPDVSTRCFNPQVLKVTPKFLKKRGHEIYYVLDQIPGDFSGSILIQYTLKIQEEEDEILPLMISWPISLPEPQVLLNVGNVSIDSSTSIRGDIVSTGEANTTVIQ